MINNNRIDEIYKDLQYHRKSGDRKSISYYAGVRLDISEYIRYLLENRENIEDSHFNKYIHRCNMLMELAEGLKKDVNSRAQNIEKACIELSNERYDGELWGEILRRAREIKKHNIN